MNIAKRQVSILYELAFHQDYLSYTYFQNLLNITEKTIREDIKTINYYYKPSQIHISYKKGYGYILVGKEENKVKLRNQLESVYTDVFDVEYNYSNYTADIIYYFYQNEGPITLEQIASKLNLSSRTVTKLLADVRKNIEEYACKLVVKPHYGFLLSGKEIHKRLLFTQNVQRYFYEEKETNIFSTDYKYEKLIQICRRYLKKTGATVSEAGLTKLIMYILVAAERIQKKQNIVCEEVQLETGKELYDKFSFSKWNDELQQVLKTEFSKEEQIYMCCMVAYIFNLGSVIQNKKYLDTCKKTYARVLEKLDEIGFYNASDEMEVKEYFMPLIEDAVIMKDFRIRDHFYSTYARKTIKSSSFSCAIAYVVYKEIQKELNVDSMNLYWKLCFSVYAYIRNISVTKKLNAVAVYTPYEKQYGESLKRRILNRWKEIIKSIEVVTIEDLQGENKKQYDCLIYCDSANPVKNSSIASLKVNYYFNNQDVKNFYEDFFVPSHIYHRAFGKIYKSDYYVNYHYKNMEEIKKILQESTTSEFIRKQIDALEDNAFIMHDGTINITLYAQKLNQAFSKLFFLEKHASVNGYRFNRIFVHCIALNHDLYCLRTTEKVMRNILVIDDTTDIVAKEPYIDFYEYYIGNGKIVLEEKR